MSDLNVYLISLIPAGFFSIFLLSRIFSGIRPKALISYSKFITLALAFLAIGVFASVVINGGANSGILGNENFGFSIKVDALSAFMSTLISILGYFVLRFSYNYLDGDKRQGYFIGGIAITLTSVAMLILSGQLFHFVIAWICTSLTLHKLLVFYKERPKAVFAANKKFIVARISDICLIAAAILIGTYFGTGDLQTIFSSAESLLNANAAVPFSLQIATLLIVITAALKSAQFPSQAWLLEVMETPTPVSALLHAGILNAGIFLVSRFSDIMVLSPISSYMLIIIGTTTALFASSVMLTQANIKTSLAYSSAGHMGFMMIQCGLGAFPLAILHLVAHSFYKAHAFLSSGTIYRAKEKYDFIVKETDKTLSPWQKIFASTVLASIFVVITATLAGIHIFETIQNFSMAIFFIAGISLLISPVFKKGINFSLLYKIAIAAIATAGSFFVLERLGEELFDEVLAHSHHSSLFNTTLISLSALAFIVISWAQNFLPSDSSSPFWNKVYVALKNAFYSNTVFSLLTGELNMRGRKDRINFENAKAIETVNSKLPALAETFSSKVDIAINRVTPVWPLQDFVAVNPYHGIADYSFRDASVLMAEMAGSKTFMDKDFYVNALERGLIRDEDIKEVLNEEGISNISVLEIKEALYRADTRKTEVNTLPLICDLASEITGKDWTNIFIEKISLWCTNYYDQGQASWAYPWRDESLFRAWLDEVSLDSYMDLVGLKGFRSFVQSLPNDSEKVIALALNELGIDEGQVERYCHRLLMSIGGWAAYTRYFHWQAALYGTKDEKIKDFLAVCLVHELAIFRFLNQNTTEMKEFWEESKQLFEMKNIKDHENLAYREEYIMQLAFERSWQQGVLNDLFANKPISNTDRNKLQMIFCIDVRSEVYRRNLESLDSKFQTLGFAGFFGFPIEFYKLGEHKSQPQGPALLPTSGTIRETIKNKTNEEVKIFVKDQSILETAANIWMRFKMSAVSCFAFVGPIGFAYLPKLLKDSFPQLKKKKDSPERMPTIEVHSCEETGTKSGFDLETRIGNAYGALNAMSLTKDFAPFVLITGHTSSTVNNPHDAGLQCGACCGHTGEYNARVAAAILNDPEVRFGLKSKGIDIPEDTIFLATIHDTTTDKIKVFDEEIIPANRLSEYEYLKSQFEIASAQTRLERSIKLSVENDLPLDEQIFSRATDWSQVRPEWGLAGCSSFIAAPRSRTKGLDLEGKAFLHDYIWQQDTEFSILNLIMTAPMIVASWINYQYYASVVDNKVFGAGNKTLHNVTGLLGVLEGNGGDLRTGLSIQSIFDGEEYVHQPRRLSVFVEAPIDAINNVINNNPLVKNLLDNKWLHFFAIDSETGNIKKYAGNFNWINSRGGEAEVLNP